MSSNKSETKNLASLKKYLLLKIFFSLALLEKYLLLQIRAKLKILLLAYQLSQFLPSEARKKI